MKTVLGKPARSSHSKKQARAQREPWLLAASLSLANYPAQKIVALYRTRMQIEEAFRDLKCERYSLGFSLNLSRAKARREILLMIAALALFALWLIGVAAVSRSLQYRHQSNSPRNRPVLSVISLALQVVRQNQYLFSKQELLRHLYALSSSCATG